MAREQLSKSSERTALHVAKMRHQWLLRYLDFKLTGGKLLGRELQRRLADPGYSQEQPGRQLYDDPSELDW